MTTFKQAARAHQIHFLCKAQMALEKVRSGGFDLPDEVTREVQAIMVSIPKIISRLEERTEFAGAEQHGNKRDVILTA